MGIATNIVLEHAHRDAEGQRAWSALGTAEPTEEEEEQLELQNNVKKALFQGDATLQRAATSKEKLAWLTVPKSEGSSTDGVSSKRQSFQEEQGLGLSPLRHTTPFNDTYWQVANGVLCMQLRGADPRHKTWDLGFSSDGKRLVTCGSDGCVVLYNTEDGAELARIDAWDEVVVQACTMSPCGKFIAAGGADGFVKVWDCKGEAPVQIMEEKLHKVKTVRRKRFSVSRVAFSRDSSCIASAGHDGKVTVWSLSEKKSVVEFSLPSSLRSNGMLHVEFSQQAGVNKAIACGDNGTVVILDLVSGSVRSLNGLNDIVLHCCFSKNAKFVAASNSTGKAHIWSVDAVETVSELFSVSTSNVHSVAFDPEVGSDGDMPAKMLVGTDEGKMIMINLEAGKFGNQMGVIDARGFGAGAVRHVCFSNDGRVILGAGTGEECLIFDADTMALLYKLEPGFPGVGHMAAAFSPDSCKVAVGLDEEGTGAVVVWDITSGAPSTLLHPSSAGPETDWVPHAHFVGAGSHVAVTTHSGELEIWDAQSSELKSTLPGMQGSMTSVTASASGTFIAVGTLQNRVLVWDATRPQQPPALFAMNGRAVAISCGGLHVAGWKSGGSKVTVAPVGDPAATADLEWSGRRLSSFRFSSNGAYAVMSGDQPYLEVWKLGSRAPTPSDRLEALPGDDVEAFHDVDAHVSDDNALQFAAVSTNGHIYLWQCSPGSPAAVSFSTSFPGHIPTHVSFSPDGQSIVTFGREGHVILWPVAEHGELRRVMGGRKMHAGSVYDVAWSSDSSMVVSCGEDGDEGLEEAHVYDADSGSVIATLAGEPGCRFNKASFNRDGRLVQLCRTDGKVAVYTRAAARGMMVTDFSFWYNEAGDGFRTDEVVEALQNFPQSANHQTRAGHNLLTAAVAFKDSETLERVVNLMPAGSPVYSLVGGKGRDALALAIKYSDDGLVYDLLMSVADGKSTHMSAASVTACWADLCDQFPDLVVVFLSKMQLETVADSFKYGDTTGILNTEQSGDRMVVNGSADYIPDCVPTFWDVCLRGRLSPKLAKAAAAGEKPVQKRCNSLRVGLPFASAPGMDGMLKPLVTSEVNTQVFGTPVVRALLKWKWEKFARRAFMLECFFHMLQLVSFTSFAILLSYEKQFPCDSTSTPPTFTERFGNPISIVGLVMETFSLAIALRNLSKEFRQMWAAGSPWKYFSDAWNILDFISYTIIIFILPLNLVAEQVATCEQGQYSTPGLQQLVAIEVIFLWGELVHFAQGFRSTGALVRIIERTIADIKWFMVLQIILMIGFGTAFNVLFIQQRCDLSDEERELHEGYTCNIAYSDIFYSLLSMVGLVFGDISVLDYYKENSPAPFWTTIIMILYMFIVFVVLFNMLIALMGETFVEVKSVEEVEFLRGRADIICSVEDTMGKKRLADREIFSKYLHVLEIKEDEEVKEALAGISGENEAQRSLQGLQDTVMDELARVQAEMVQMKEDLKNIIRQAQRTMLQTAGATPGAQPRTPKVSAVKSRAASRNGTAAGTPDTRHTTRSSRAAEVSTCGVTDAPLPLTLPHPVSSPLRPPGLLPSLDDQ